MAGSGADTEVEDPEEVNVERAATGALPAIYIDSWFTTTWNGLTRLTLGEVLGDTTYYRTSVVMSLGDAKLLAEHLIELVERHKAKPDRSNPVDKKATF